MELEYRWMGEVDYQTGLAHQEAVRERVLSGAPGSLLLLTHPHTITVGRNGKESNILAPDELREQGCSVYRVKRGGDVTYHGPGQLVGYPVLPLTRIRVGVSDYMRRLGTILEDCVAAWGVRAHWDDARPGLWVGDDKLAAFGVHVHRGVTTHGFALNVCPDLRYYQRIVPCGLSGRGVTSLERLIPGRVPELWEIRAKVRTCFAANFGVDWISGRP